MDFSTIKPGFALYIDIGMVEQIAEKCKGRSK